MNAPVQLAQLQNPQHSTAVVQAGFFDLQGFELLQRVAKAFASSSLVPAQYQGNVANCMIALNLARRLNADELMVMQNLYIVHGNPGWSAKFLIACVNSCGRYESLRYEWRGDPGADDYGCRAWTIEKSTGEKLFGAWVDWKMVKAEGWNKKNGSKWLTMPDQMFIYRSAAFWQRGYAPEISMGLSTAEELADVVDVRADGSYTVTSESLRTDMRGVDQTTGEITHDPSPTVQKQAFDTAAEVVETKQASPRSEPRQQAAANPREEAVKPGFDMDAFAVRLEACRDTDTLDLMADEISGMQRDQVVNDDQADVLLSIYRRRRDELSRPPQQTAPAATTAPVNAPLQGSRRRAAAPGTAPE